MNTTEETDKQQAEPSSEKSASTDSLPAKSLNTKIFIPVVMCLVLVAGLIFLGVTTKNKKVQQPGTEEPANSNQITQQTDVMLANGKYDEALTEWNKFLERQTTPEEKVNAHLGIASVYMNKQDFAAALEQYKKADQLSPQPNSQIYNAIINVAQVTNNNALEVEYSQKAIDAMDPKHPLYEADKGSYERRIEELNAKSD